MFKKLGNRMKSNYEDRTRFLLPRRTHTIIRCDGKSFRTYTKKFKRPFDDTFINAMNVAAQTLCKEAQGSLFAYVQSDEISVILCDYHQLNSEAWFDNNLQKITSVSASIVTAAFNAELLKTRSYDSANNFAVFDARTFTIPDKVEALNYFVWRQNDAIRNSVQVVAQSRFSDKQLYGKNLTTIKQMLADVNDPWENYSQGKRQGRLVRKVAGQKGFVVHDAPIFSTDMQDLLTLTSERSEQE
jgi:tRNA(His) guanylyltransferase